MNAHGKASSRLDDMLAMQRAAFLRDGPPSLAQRRGDLQKLKGAILARRRLIERALSSDFRNRSADETAIMEMIPVVQGINYLRRNLRRWMRPEKRHVALHFLPGRARVVYQPLGVVGIMSPWNYPLSLTLMPLATAIAAGNRVMIKPSEFTPATSGVLAEMLRKTFAEDQVAVVTGDADVGAAFSALPFDHLVFTGSTAVGRAVMKAASANLVPVTLELGGKSPVIIEKGYPIDKAAGSIAYGKLANAGQTCIAPDYLLVHESAVEPYLAAYEKAVRTLYPNGPADGDYTSIIDERRYCRLQTLLEDARAKGARVIELGSVGGDGGGRPHTLAPTVVLGGTDDMAIMQEEIFGPVLAVVAYRDLDEAIGYINARPRPLALYYFGHNGADRRKVLSRTISGNVTINDTLLHFAQEDLPFGGVGASGIGAYHGIEGFKSLSHAKGVFVQARWNLSGLLRPPFGRVAEVITKAMLR
jgi:coniferyl-aldehyde dehydrogenase